ncbi:hypothetical protein SADUNF_Sadunf03G0036100 [Salix dunnii]|uniref:Cytochrome c oxidase subunit Vb n=1 Tax=Salix dunnii TaxID=1413687 RepID=A0A835KH01_9ROSI|nr:hypothetical protein SADUNF_Sadunf03G0036100 [Salix dunnii]
MWRRLASSHLKALATTASSASTSVRSTQLLLLNRSPSASVFNRYLSAGSVDGAVKKRVEDVTPIATGHEREELEAELEGRKILDIDYPEGPFGTKVEPAVIKSYYDKRIVGCPGGEGEDEHDVVWFWLEKGKPHECPVCTQQFVLQGSHRIFYGGVLTIFGVLRCPSCCITTSSVFNGMASWLMFINTYGFEIPGICFPGDGTSSG